MDLTENMKARILSLKGKPLYKRDCFCMQDYDIYMIYMTYYDIL